MNSNSTLNQKQDFHIADFQNYFFVGIAGTGMSAIAQYLKGIGKNVAGSDRLFNKENKLLIQSQFESQQINCHFQDGSGINETTQVVVISTAIEETNVELQKARSLNIKVIKRSELLAAISAEKKTIAVGGTSGKSTTTAMIFHILQENGYNPSLMTGAGLTSLQKKGLPGNAWVGKSDWLVIEADESDGSIVNYIPEIGIVLNIDRDHKEFSELMELFTTFKGNTRGTFIVNNDHALTKSISQSIKNDFGSVTESGFCHSNFTQTGFNIQFKVNNIDFDIPVIGKHNMENATAAVAAAFATGIGVADSAKALKSYVGIFRRTQLVGEKNGRYVIDDFAHNPSEVEAAIKTCQMIGKKVFAWFQPHGYGPLKFMHEELSQKISTTLRPVDYFLTSEVYYAGGTVNKDINSDVVVNAVKSNGKKALMVPDRNQIVREFNALSEQGDVLLLMGARDPSLAEFANSVLQGIN